MKQQLELKQEVIPEGWESIDLSKFNIIKGKSSENYFSGNYAYLTPEYLRGNKDPNLIEEFKGCIFVNEQETILLWDGSKAGEVFRSKKGILASTMVKFDISNKISSFFFYFSLKYLEEKLKSESRGTGIPHVDRATLKRSFYIIPKSIREQEKIASILQEIDNSIEGTQSVINKFKRIKNGLVQDLFKFGINNRKIIKREINSYEYEFPKDWLIKNVGKSSTLKGRIGWQGLTTQEYLEEGDYFLITGTDFKNGKVEWSTCHFVKKFRYDQDKNIQIKIKDILITKDGTIGKIAFVNSISKPTTLNSGVFVLRPQNNSYDPEFMYHILMSARFDRFIENLKAGSTISHLYQKDFVNFEFSIPKDPKEQKRIADILTSADNKIESEEKYLEKLIKIKRGLMQDLLTGKVRVEIEK